MFTMEGLSIIARAYCYAAKMHGAQRRKFTDELYIVHPLEVAEIVTTVTSDPETIAAALLHDVVEDTFARDKDIRKKFGDRVADIVYYLTDISQPEDGNRSVRKAKDRAHNVAGPAEAHDVKLADLISNSKSIVEHDPDFAVTYMKEKELLIEELVKGHPALRLQALAIIHEYHRNKV